MSYKPSANNVLHWNYRGFTEFPLHCIQGEETEITDIYLKENLISRIPSDIGKLNNLESLYLSGNDITELPREISRLSCLKCLDLSGNRLQYIPSEIGEMSSLKFLILDENELSELPLRISELRMLRYLSVCDNKLKWLPQRPVYNYHHCEFRFWRNRSLAAIPYSLWYHMFRGQQARSLKIGCISFSTCEETICKCNLVLRRSENVDDFSTQKIHFPRKYEHIIENNVVVTPSLMEICKRKFYQMLCSTSKRMTSSPTSIYSDLNNWSKFENNNNISNLEDQFGGFNLESSLFAHTTSSVHINKITKDDQNIDKLLIKSKLKGYCVPSDIIEEHFYYLPKFIKDDLCNGSISTCENINCKKPIFDFVYLEFCLEKIILIEDTEDIVLSAALCSKSCAETWKSGKNVLYSKFT